MITSRFLMGIALSLSLVSCSSHRGADFDSLLNESFEPQLERFTVSMFVNVAQNTNLDYQLAYLASLMDDLGANQVSKLYFRLTPLPGGAYADDLDDVMIAIKRSLKKRGARAAHIEETSHGRPVGHLVNAPVSVSEGSSVLVGVDRYIVVPPECNREEANMRVGDSSNEFVPSIGCTNATNRVMMAASPLDLLRGRTADLGDARTAGRAAGARLSGEGGSR